MKKERQEEPKGDTEVQKTSGAHNVLRSSIQRTCLICKECQRLVNKTAWLLTILKSTMQGCKRLFDPTSYIKHLPLNFLGSSSSLVSSFLVLREFPFPEDLCLYIKPMHRK